MLSCEITRIYCITPGTLSSLSYELNLEIGKDYRRLPEPSRVPLFEYTEEAANRIDRHYHKGQNISKWLRRFIYAKTPIEDIASGFGGCEGLLLGYISTTFNKIEHPEIWDYYMIDAFLEDVENLRKKKKRRPGCDPVGDSRKFVDNVLNYLGVSRQSLEYGGFSGSNN